MIFCFCSILVSKWYLIVHNISECKCHQDGSMGHLCDEKGVCSCEANFGGDKCNECKNGYYPFPTCNKGVK